MDEEGDGATLLRAEGNRAFEAAFDHMAIADAFGERDLEGPFDAFELGSRRSVPVVPPPIPEDELPF